MPEYSSYYEAYEYETLEPLYSHIYDTSPIVVLGLNLGLHFATDILKGKVFVSYGVMLALSHTQIHCQLCLLMKLIFGMNIRQQRT